MIPREWRPPNRRWRGEDRLGKKYDELAYSDRWFIEVVTGEGAGNRCGRYDIA